MNDLKFAIMDYTQFIEHPILKHVVLKYKPWETTVGEARSNVSDLLQALTMMISLNEYYRQFLPEADMHITVKHAVELLETICEEDED